jgi:hypothetical protein
MKTVRSFDPYAWHWRFAFFPRRFELNGIETRIWLMGYLWRFSRTKRDMHGVYYEYRLPGSDQIIGEEYEFLEGV